MQRRVPSLLALGFAACVVGLAPQACSYEVPAPLLDATDGGGEGGATGDGAVTCPGSQHLCADGCFDTQKDATHCGESCAKCGIGEVCTAGACVCDTGKQLCAKANPPGCFDVSKDAAHCGASCTPCGSGFVCQNGGCFCPPANTCPSGCIDTQTSHDDCGTCGHACAAGDVCTKGKCECPAGQHRCAADSLCYPDTDVAHCGAACDACATNFACAGDGKAPPTYACSCNKPGFTACSASSCVDLTSDASNCAKCGRACKTARFAAGACTTSVCNIPVVTNGPSYVGGVAVDPYDAAPTALYAAARDGFAQVEELPFATGTPANMGTGIQFPNAVIAARNIAGQTLVAVISTGSDSPVQFGYWNSTLDTSNTAVGGANRVAIDKQGLAYYTETTTRLNGGVQEACLYWLDGAFTRHAFGCRRAGNTNASPIVHFDLVHANAGSPIATAAYGVSSDRTLEYFDFNGDTRTTIPFNNGGLTPLDNRYGTAIRPDESFFYYVTQDGGGGHVRQIKMANKVDSAVMDLPGEAPAAVLADDNYVYVVSTTSTLVTVRYTPHVNFSVKSLGSVTRISSGYDVTSFVQTPSEIFFVRYNQVADGKILRVAKP